MAEHGDTGGTEYSVDFGEGDQRNMTVRELVAAYNSGRVTGETYVWAEGFGDWKPLADVPEIVEALHAPAAGSATASPSPWASKPTASVPRTAARTSGGRSATADLFGGIDSAGSEDDVATSAPDHPPAGLSGSSGGAGSSASGTGARNESSVLFSLSALTSAAQTSRPSTRPAASTTSSTSRDDSGLIDLKALTAAAMKSDAGAAGTAAAPVVPAVVPMPPPLGVAPPPLGMSPFGGVTATTDIGGYPQQKSRAPLYIGGGLALGLGAVALAIALKEPPPPPPVVAAPAPTMPVAPAPAPSPTQEAAQPPATGTAASEAAPATSAKPAARSGYRRPSSAPAAKKPAAGGSEPASAAPKPAAPKRNPCGCANGDLQCAMRCAAKGG